MWKRCTILMFITCVPQGRPSDLVRCLHQILSETSEEGDRLGVLYSDNKPSFQRQLLPPSLSNSSALFLRKIMDLSLGSLQTFHESLPLIPPSKVKRNSDFDTFCIWLHHYEVQNFSSLLTTLRSYRIFGFESKLIVVVETEDQNIAIYEILRLIWDGLRLFYCFIIVYFPFEQPSYFSLYSFDPFRIEFLDIQPCNGSAFPSLPETFFRHKLRVGYFPRPPYIFPPKLPHLPPEGSEIKILQTIAESLDIDLIYKTSPPGEEPLITIDNGKYVGLFRMLVENEIDVLSGGITSTTAREMAAAALPQYILDETILLVPRTLKESQWKMLYGAFSPEVWLAILIGVFLFSVVLCAFSRKFNAAICCNAVLVVVVVHFEKSLTNYALRKFAKSILCILFFYAMITTTYYKSSFTTLLTTPADPKSIQTIGEAYEKGLVFYFIPPAMPSILVQPNKELWGKILSPDRHVMDMNVTMHAEKTAIERTGISITNKELYAYNYNTLFRKLGGSHLVFPLPERLFPFPIFMFFAPGHPLYRLFLIKQFYLVEAGLTEYWLESINYIARVNRIDMDSGKARPMSFHQVSAIFNALIGLLFVNVAIFGCEVFYFYFCRLYNNYRLNSKT